MVSVDFVSGVEPVGVPCVEGDASDEEGVGDCFGSLDQ